MGLLGTYRLKILFVFFIPVKITHLIQYGYIFFLEDFCPSSFTGLATRIIDAILLYGIYKEEAQYLNSLLIELMFTLEVLLYGGANLYTPYQLLRDCSHCLTLIDFLAIAQTNTPLHAIYPLYDKAITISL